MSTLTIAIPFYKGHEFLREAIRSVLAQSSSDWRLIICDDCGPQTGTRELVDSFGDGRIRYFRNEANLGLAANWNRCLDLAETDLVCLLHGDDRLLPNYVGVMTTAAKRYSRAAMFFCRSTIIDAQGRPCTSFPDYFKKLLEPSRGVIHLEGRRALDSLLLGDFIMCPTACYRKTVVGKRRFDASWRFVLDLEFFTRLLIDGDELIGLPHACYAYRRHSDNLTSQFTHDLSRFREESLLYDHFAKLAKERGWNRTAKRARAKSIIKLNLLFNIASDLVLGEGHRAAKKAAFLSTLFNF